MTTEKEFRCEWREPYYADAFLRVVEAYFDKGNGYDDDDRARIAALAVGESVELGIGGHTVRRIG